METKTANIPLSLSLHHLCWQKMSRMVIMETIIKCLLFTGSILSEQVDLWQDAFSALIYWIGNRKGIQSVKNTDC